MQCSCEVDYDDGYGPDLFSESDRVARKAHTCCECGREIAPGETYHIESGRWDDEFQSYKTCADCISLRDAYCCGFIYTRVRRDIREQVIEPVDGEVLDSRVAELTPAARAWFLAQVEEVWEHAESRDARRARGM